MTTNSETLAGLPPVSIPFEPSDLKLEMVTSYCGSASCPTIYRSDRGTLVVQGYAVSADRVDVELPAGEMLVEIPIELLAAAARSVS